VHLQRFIAGGAGVLVFAPRSLRIFHALVDRPYYSAMFQRLMLRRSTLERIILKFIPKKMGE
jgi:hypothetical protein